MLRVISEEITAYRRQIDERKNDLPLWERKVLTCDEAAAYSGIGIRRLRKMALAKGCPFAIANGTQILIAREMMGHSVWISTGESTLNTVMGPSSFRPSPIIFRSSLRPY